MTDTDGISALEIEIERPAEASVVRLSGVLDLATAEQLRSVAASELPLGMVILDMAKVTFCDSSGLRVLLDLRRRAQDAKVALRLADPHPAVSRLFQLTGTEDRFSIYPDARAALSA